MRLAASTCIAVLLLSVAGCAAPLNEITSGRIGCSPDEISIVETDGGWKTQTWTATCRGRTYYCSELRDATLHSGFVNGAPVTLFGNQVADISCKESSAAATRSDKRGHAGGTEAPSRSNEPFSEVAGFKFGSEIESVRRSCTEASLVFQELDDGRFACSGAPEDVGIPVTSIVETCDDRVCHVELNANPDGADWTSVMDRYVMVRRALEKKYGDWEPTTTDPLEDCSSGVKECFAKGRVRTSAKWRFSGGSELSVVASGGKPGAKPVLVLRYRKASTNADQGRLRPAAPKAAEPLPADSLDTVLLTNGGRLRGTIFEEDPQTGVGIRLPDGGTRRIEAGDVKKVLYHAR